MPRVITLGGMEERFDYLRECCGQFDKLPPEQQSAMRAFAAELGRIFSSSDPRRRTLCVKLPLPPPEAHPNNHARRMVAARKVKEYRRQCGELAWIDCQQQLGIRPKFRRAIIDLRFYTATGQAQDSDNLIAWIKSSVDSLADAGVIDNDRHLTYNHPHVFKAGEFPDRPRLEIVITEA